MRLSSWRCTNDCSWHRLSTNRFRATNPIHSIQTDWNPIRSNPIGLSQTHWSLIRWNHWIGLNHSTQSLIRSTSNCSSTKGSLSDCDSLESESLDESLDADESELDDEWLEAEELESDELDAEELEDERLDELRLDDDEAELELD